MGCVPSKSAQTADQQSAPAMPTAPKTVEMPTVRTQQPQQQDAAYAPVAVEEPVAPSATVEEPQPTHSTEIDPLLQEHNAPPKQQDDDLLLDFETFLLFPDVQAVLNAGTVEKYTLLDLFKIVDKNNDGFVNDQEREDLLELISLSYGKKSPRHSTNVENGEPFATSEAPSFSAAGDQTSSAPPVEPAVEESEGSRIDALPAPPATEAAADSMKPAGPNKGKDGRAKPKIIKFIAPQLVDSNHSTPRPAADALPPKPVVPAERVRSLESSSGKGLQDGEISPGRETPRQKKGFMVTKRESFDKTEVICSAETRFFTLENGCLSYMDSTSKKPPFSMSHRVIELTGVDISVSKNVIELAPRRRPLSQSGSDKDDPGEIVLLELKTEQECAEWMKAIQEHLEFSATAE
jgi:hypothetical protein